MVDEATAAIALEALGDLPAAKRIAAATLYLQSTRSMNREAALSCAARVYADRLGPTPGGLKKVVSEGRAILQFGFFEMRPPEAAADLPPHDLLCVLETAIRRVNLREVTRARALAFAGGRGGRPAARASAAYSAVRKLMGLAEAGDAAARAELTAIRDLIGQAAALPHRADRPAASR